MRYRIMTAGESSAKLAHLRGVESAILYLAPYTLARVPRWTVCPNSTPGCRAACLYRAGRGQQQGVQDARVRRTRLLAKAPDIFHSMLRHDLQLLRARAYRLGVPAVARLNGTSDLDWTPVYREHPGVVFWEYSKDPARVRAWLRGQYPRNLARMVYSRSEAPGSDATAIELCSQGATATVVFSTPRHATLPDTWNGLPVVDGDASDARWRDPRGVIVGLRAKGPARHDRSGFVVNV